MLALTADTRKQFRDPYRRFDFFFDPTIVRYNGHVDPFDETIIMGPVQHPQRKGRCPRYARDKLVELQEKFDEFEAVGVFRRPEYVGVAVEYLDPLWKYIVVSDLTSAFNQIPLEKDSLKYCGVVTQFRGVRVYTRCAMGTAS